MAGEPATPAISPLDSQALEVAAYWQAIRRGAIVAIAIHIVFAIIGLVLHAAPLAWLQLMTIVVYSASYALSKRRANKGIMTFLTWLDLLGHSTVAGWIVGPEAGFQFYSWILLPLIFTNIDRSLRAKVISAAALSILYVVIDAALHEIHPLVQLQPYALYSLRYFNVFCFLLTMTLTAMTHFNSVMQAETRLRTAAETDSLTGLLNRRRMSDRMTSEMSKARDDEMPLAVLLLDIDHFKSINDRFGHACGDEVLANIGPALAAAVRGHDIVSRWGGEEFLLLLPGVGRAKALESAERIRAAVATLQLPDQRAVTATIGVANWRAGEGLETTIQRADDALYQGKAAGRDCVVAEGAVPEPVVRTYVRSR
jgi:diguanylate cyclase (GGDEF)-like protein